MLIFSSYRNKSTGNRFCFLVWTLIWNILKPRLFHISENHQYWVNLYIIGIWCHAPYTSMKLLINRLDLHFELSIILIIYFIQILQDYLPQVFIELIMFTVEILLKDIILWHYCGLGFCVNVLAKWAAKESKLLSCMHFWNESWKCCSIFVCILSISNVEITTGFACDSVKNT